MFRLSLVAHLCLLTAAADCASGSCSVEDETSLIQVRQQLSIAEDRQAPAGSNDLGFTFEVSSVENAQNDLKAAQSNTSVQMYAASTARLNEAKAIWAASKANLAARGATVQQINAERAAAAAVQAAQDEVDMWYGAMQARMDAETQKMIAEADWTAKHNTTKIAAADAANATAFRSTAQDNSSIIKLNEQMLVNDAAASAAAKYALDAKVVAASRKAAYPSVYAEYKKQMKLKDAARKASWKSQMKSYKDEIKARKQTSKAWRDAQKAGAAGVTGMVSGVAGEPTWLGGGLALGGSTETVTTVVTPALLETDAEQDPAKAVYNDTNLKAVQASSDLNAQAADQSVWAAVSDEKRAKAAYDIARNAEKVALQNKKVAQNKADTAYKKASNLGYQASVLARKSRAALERAKQLAWQLNNSFAANKSAFDTAIVAENVTYQTADAQRLAIDDTTGANVKYTGQVASQTWSNAQAAANASTLAAQGAAQDAMVSRISSGYDKAYAGAAQLNYTQAQANLTMANKLKSGAASAANTAMYKARRAASQAQLYDRKTAAANLSPDIVTPA